MNSTRNFSIKGWIAIALSLLIVLAFVFGSPVSFVQARIVSPPSEGTIGSGTTLLSSVGVPSRVALGNPIAISAPNGVRTVLQDPTREIVVDVGGGFAIGSFPHQTTVLGNYELSFFHANGGYYRSFIIEVYLENEFFLEIEHNGATIPEFAPSGVAITLPRATVVYYDYFDQRHNIIEDDDSFADINGTGQVRVTAVDGNGNVLTISSNNQITLPAGRNTSVFVRYEYNVADGHVLYRDFRIRTQAGFTNTANPTLAVSPPPRDANINTRFELPIATASDNYESNVRIQVTVTGPSGAVQVANVDRETGWAVDVDDDAPEVFFDNTSRNMFFYPTELGDYIVTYRAFNNSFADGEHDSYNASQQHTFTVRAIDRLAPVIEFIDDYRIPSQWGAVVNSTVFGSDGTPSAGNAIPGRLFFPGPQVTGNANYASPSLAVRDNFSSPNTSSGSGGLTVEVTLSNPQGNVVWSFGNILHTAGTNRITDNSSWGHAGTFAAGFDFGVYRTALNAADTNIPFVGEYVLLYRLRDGAGQISEREYRINVVDTFTDFTTPSLSLNNVASFVVADQRMNFLLPVPQVTSQNALRPRVEYTLSVDGTDIDLEGNERLIYADGIVYVTSHTAGFVRSLAAADRTPQRGIYRVLDTADADGRTTITLTLTAFNNVGNQSLLPNSNTPQSIDREIDIIVPRATTGINTAIDTEGLRLSGGEQGTPIDLGGVVIGSGLSANDRDLVGFQVIVRAPVTVHVAPDASDPSGSFGGGEIINTVSLDTWFHRPTGTNAYELRVNNIHFVAGVSGIHMISIRAFDIAGNHTVYTGHFNVSPREGGGIVPNTSALRALSSAIQPSSFPPTMSILQPVVLTDWRPVVDNPNFNVRRRFVNSATFELMGRQFTPMVAGSFTVEEWAFDDFAYEGTDWQDNAQLINDRAVDATATDTAQGSIRLVRPLPSHVAISTVTDSTHADFSPVVLPNIIASSANQSFVAQTPTMTVNGTSRVLQHSRNITGWPNALEQGYFFIPDVDGRYEIAFRAIGVPDLVVAMYVGNVDAPAMNIREYQVTGAGRNVSTTSTRGHASTFNFMEILLPGMPVTSGTAFNNWLVNEGNGYTFRRELVDPSGNTVATLSTPHAQGAGWTLTTAGNWSVIYTVTNRLGQTMQIVDTMIVAAPSTGGSMSIAAIATTLIILSVVLVIGAFVYLIRFKKVKAPKNLPSNDKQ